MRFDKYKNSFKDYLYAKNYSRRTQDSYTQEIKKFVQFLEENYIRVTKITEITKDIIIDYSNYLASYRDNRGKSLSTKTQKIKLIALKMFFQYLLKQDYILKNPTANIELPKDELTLPRNIPTEEEVMLILNSIKLTTPQNIRNKAIIETFYCTGIRTSELANLKIHDVDFHECILIIEKGKGNKSRNVPLGQYALEYIKLYLEKARKHMLKGKKEDQGYLFLSSQGNPFNRETINRCVMHQVTKGLGIKKHLSCYSLRHAAATHLVKNGVDIRFVSELLGHSSLKTTGKYCHINIEDLKKMHALYHPREQSKKKK